MKPTGDDGLSSQPVTGLSEKVIGKMKEKEDRTGGLLGQRKSIMNSSSSSSSSSSSRSSQDVKTTTTEPENTISQAGFDGAGKYLLSGGIAGAVSRTATAPFDRLKVYLITAQPRMNEERTSRAIMGRGGSMTNLMESLKSIYNEHSKCQINAHHPKPHSWGLRNFFIGNGLNVIKVFPESAIKFFVYEYAKNFLFHPPNHPSLHPDEHRSNLVRFMAGGLAGVVSQVLIYPIETLSQSSHFFFSLSLHILDFILSKKFIFVETQLMSSTINESFQGRALLVYTIKRLYQTGGVRGYYKGLMAATLGVFPYSGIFFYISFLILIKNAFFFLC
jgi:solute carrier family 25 phosphate transporter 23/24/25/41